jgi:transposase
VSEIARQLDVDRKTVRKYLKQAPREYERKPKSWKLDPWRAHLRERWEQGVHNANRLFLELQKRGYDGGLTQVKKVVRPWRSEGQERAFVRFETAPGEQAQMDWEHFGNWDGRRLYGCQGRSKTGSSSHLMNHSRHFAERGGIYKRQISSGGLRWMVMGERALVPDAGEVVLDQLMVEGRSRLVMVLRPAGGGSVCPECQQASRRIHSRYRRRLNDLPWEGIPVRIELRVCRFFCETEDCGHHIFTERLPKTVKHYARRTCRLSEALERIALVLGGSAGSRLAEQLGILASDSTLLRPLRRKAVATAAQAPRVLGIDDWAWRKGRRYGTILCDLERGKVVNLLPDRSAESTAQWLRAHPGTEIISRDRASLYAEAATKAAPHAAQVADRWHLLHNMSEALFGALVPHHRLLTEVAQVTAGRAKAATSPDAQLPLSAKPPSRKQRAQEENRERRLARYEAVMEQLR